MRFAVVLLFALTACATYRDQLLRSQRAFDDSQYDRSLAMLRDLEPSLSRLSTAERTQYAYLRGMADYRIGYKRDARHWLSIAKAYDDASAGMLPADWKTRVGEALADLNGVVYDKGIAALSSTRRREGEAVESADAGTE